MANEAKFSVIFPASGFISSQMETFESLVQKNGLPISIPLSMDSNGNYIISSGMSLRDAQILRRQVSGYGFNADVVSDAVRNQNKSDGLGGAADNKTQDNSVDAWASMEMPDLDLGLSDGDDLDGEQAEWSGDNWLDPDMTSSRTLSVNAQALLEVAKGGGDFSFEDLNALQNVPILEKSESSDNPDEKPTVTSLMKNQVSIESHDELQTEEQPSLSLDNDGDMTAVYDQAEEGVLTDANNPVVPLLEQPKSSEAEKSQAEESQTKPEKSPAKSSEGSESAASSESSSFSSDIVEAMRPRRRDSMVSTEFLALDALRAAPKEEPKPKSKLPLFLIILIVVLVVGIIGCYLILNL